MSTVIATPRVRPEANEHRSVAPAAPMAVAFHYRQSDNFVAMLRPLGASLLVDRATGRREAVTEVAGFTRGLAMVGNYAFVGLSKIRANSAMDGVTLADRRDQLTCGISVIDLRSGSEVGFLKFQTAVEEFFDVQLLPEIRYSEILGFQKDSLNHMFVSKESPNTPQLSE